MKRTLALMMVLLVIPPASALPFAALDAATVPGDARYDCPAPDAGEQRSPLATPCPTRIAVEGMTLGAPSLIVDPANPMRMLMVALAGTPSGGQAREGTAHMMFTTDDGGRSWTNTPLAAPQTGFRGRDTALHADADGRVTLALHDDKPNGPGTFFVWRFDSFDAARALRGTADAFTASAGAEASRLTVSTTTNATILSWQERVDGAAFLRVATRSASDTAWRMAAPLGPCAFVSNTVSFANLTYATCTPQGERAHMYALDPAAGAFVELGETPIHGDITLAISPAGRIGIAGIFTEEDTIHIRFSTGLRGFNWTTPADPGLSIHGPDAPPAARAALLALTHNAAGDSWHFVYTETPAASPTGPTATLEARASKQLIGLTPRGRFVATLDLAIDTPQARLASGATADAMSRPLVDDPRDAFATHGTREFLVHADAGTLVFGEVLDDPATVPLDYGAGVAPSQTTAQLNQPPRPKFTLGFEIAAILLVTGIIVRVLIGRIIIRSAAPPPGEESS